MGGPYNIPRDYRGETRILFIFSTKALIFTAIFAVIGLIFFYILNLFGQTMIGIIITLIFAGIGFAIGTFKMPENKKFSVMSKNAGESIDSVIKKWFIFKQKKNRVYVYKEGTKDAK